MSEDTDVEDRPMTRRDLATLGLDALNKDKAGRIAVSRNAGGVSFATALEVMEFAKLMALADSAVPQPFRKNAGMCLAVTFQAIEWQMSPFQVANKAYVVNDRIGFESQLIHAVIEARAPLQHRLDCRYEGEGPTRKCIVTGMFTNGDQREYESPQLGSIRVKNSPLWHSDPDQQLWYYASRSWARKWCPDVLMGIYTREELAENPALGREVDDKTIEGSGLHKRLQGSEVSRDEGHRPGHVESELDQIGTTGDVARKPSAADEKVVDAEPPTAPETGPLSVTCPECWAAPGAPCTTRGKPREAAHKNREHRWENSAPARAAEKTGAAEPAADQPKADLQTRPDSTEARPRNAEQYAAHVKAWIPGCTTKDELETRWKNERKLRNDCGLVQDDLEPLLDLMESAAGRLL